MEGRKGGDGDVFVVEGLVGKEQVEVLCLTISFFSRCVVGISRMSHTGCCGGCASLDEKLECSGAGLETGSLAWNVVRVEGTG